MLFNQCRVFFYTGTNMRRAPSVPPGPCLNLAGRMQPARLIETIKNIRLQHIFITVFSCFLFIAFSCAASHAGTVTLKLAHTAEPNTPLGFGVEKLAELAYEYSRGELIVKVYHSGQIGSQKELVERLRYGLVDMTTADTGFLSEYIPQLLVFELPFILRSNEHAYAALDTIGLEIARKGEGKGFKTLAIMERSQLNICSGRAPGRDPKDLRGSYMRIRKDSHFSRLMLFYMGARPVYVDDQNLMNAAELGRIDGFECTPAQVWETKLPGVQKYVSVTAHSYSAQPVLVSMARWKRLSSAQREALLLAARDAADWQRALCRKQNTDYLLKIHDNAIADVFFKPDRKLFENAAVPVWKIFASEYENGQQLIDRIRDIPE